MSLDWSVKNVKDKTVVWKVAEHDDRMSGIVKGESYLSPMAEAMINLTMVVGLGQITEQNAREFYTRAHTYECLFGASRSLWTGTESKKIFVTLDEVESIIGLRTNVTTVPAAKWARDLVAHHAKNALAREDLKHRTTTAAAAPTNA